MIITALMYRTFKSCSCDWLSTACDYSSLQSKYVFAIYSKVDANSFKKAVRESRDTEDYNSVTNQEVHVAGIFESSCSVRKSLRKI